MVKPSAAFGSGTMNTTWTEPGPRPAPPKRVEVRFPLATLASADASIISVNRKESDYTRERLTMTEQKLLPNLSTSSDQAQMNASTGNGFASERKPQLSSQLGAFTTTRCVRTRASGT